MKKVSSQMYKLEKARENKNAERFYYCISYNHIPVYPLSDWSKRLRLIKSTRPHTYLSIVLRFLNFLIQHKKNKSYLDVNDKDIRDFYIMATEFNDKGEMLLESKIQTNTVEIYRAALTSLYKHLVSFGADGLIQYTEYSADGKNAYNISTPLKTKWSDIGRQAKLVIRNFRVAEKVNETEYIKEYTEKEISALYRSFKKPVQRAIFILTLKGMRIDEVLSIKLKDYNPKAMVVQPSRSKGRKRKSEVRTVMIGPLGIQTIEKYLFDVRNPALKEIQKEGRNGSEYLFITTQTKNGIIPFTPYTQASFRSALIGAAKRAGITKNVRTHTGRSHRAIELTRLEHQGIITDEQLRLIMGWRDMTSHRPYDEHIHKEEADRITEKVFKKREESLAKELAKFEAMERENDNKS